MTEIIHLVPPDNVGVVEGYSMQCVNARYLASNPEYRKFFKVYQGMKILSCQYQGWTIEELLKAVDDINADELVMYYSAFNCEETVKLVDSWLLSTALNEVSHQSRRVRLQAVPQGNTPEEYEQCIEAIINRKRVGTIGLDVDLISHLYGSQEINRAIEVLNQKFKFWWYADNEKREFHAIGKENSCLWLAGKFPWLRSIETSIAARVTYHSQEESEDIADRVLRDGLISFHKPEGGWEVVTLNNTRLATVINALENMSKGKV